MVPVMKFSKFTIHISLIITSLFLTGCYTQFQTIERFPISDKYENYYIWDDYEAKKYAAAKNPEEVEQYVEELHELEEAEIYFKSFEAERWYRENLAHKIYWSGFDYGYDQGYEQAMYDQYAYLNSWYRPNVFSYYYHRPFFNRGYLMSLSMFGPHYAFNSFYFDPWFYGYDIYPYYGYPYYGGWGYSVYAPYVVIYNDYNRNTNYRRNAEIYRKGPRQNGLTNSRSGNTYNNGKSTYRTRSSSTIGKTGRSTSTRSGAVTRSGGSSSTGKGTVGRTRSTGRSGSSGNVGKSSSGSGTGRSTGRSSGGSVGKSRSSSGSSGSRSTGRSSTRSGNGNLSEDGSRSYYQQPVQIPVYNRKTYTIPSTTIKAPAKPAVRSRVSSSAVLRGLLNYSNVSINRSVKPYNSQKRSTITSGSGNKSSVKSKSASRSSRVKSTRSGSVAKSKSRSTGRSRGNN